MDNEYNDSKPEQQSEQSKDRDSLYSQGHREAKAADTFASALQSGGDDAEEFALEPSGESAEESEQEEQDAEEPQEPQSQFTQEQLESMAEQLGLDPSKVSDPQIAALCEQGLNILAQQQQAAENDPATIEAKYQHHYEQLSQLRANLNDPRIVEDFTRRLQEASTQEEVVEALQDGGTNLIMSALPVLLPHILPAVIDQLYPGLASMHSEATLENIWTETLESDESFRGLPAFGSKEFEAAGTALYQQNPWLHELKWQDANGYPLGRVEAMRKTAGVVARMLSGVPKNEVLKQIEQAVTTVKKQQNFADRRVTASRMSARGKSSSDAFQTRAEEDDPIMRSYNAYMNSLGAFGKGKK
jgi:hypothetical protein